MTTPNLGNRTGSVAPGDTVVADMRHDTVTRVIVHPPENAPKQAPIVSGYTVVEVQTSRGVSRWLGAEDAYIGADLRVHWSR